MHWKLLYYILFFPFLFAQVFSAPIPPRGPPKSPTPARTPSPPPRPSTPPPKLGDIVGIRPVAYEGKKPENKKVAIHPGVVVKGPSKEGRYDVAMISKKLVDNPPQNPIQKYHPDTNVFGNISLAPPKNVHVDHMKIWKDHKTGNPATPVGKEGLAQLKKEMKPHEKWVPTPAPAPAPAPAGPSQLKL